MPETAEREPDGTSVVRLQPFACECVGQRRLLLGVHAARAASVPRWLPLG